MPISQRLHWIKIAGDLLRTGSPIAAFYLTEILIGLTDLAVVGALGAMPLAAVGLGKTLLLSVMTVAFAVLSIGTILMSEKDDPSWRAAVVAGSLVLSVLFACLAVATAYSGSEVLRRSGYEAAFVTLFADYANVLALAIGPALILATLKNVLTAVGRTGIISWLAAGMVGGNLIASLLLVHGLGAWPGLGIAGAAWATAAVNLSAVSVLLLHVVRQKYLSFRSADFLKAMGTAKSIVALGWAAGAQQVLESALFIAVLYMLGLHSPLWLAAGTVAFAVMELNYAASGALGEALSARLAMLRVLDRRAELRQTFIVATALSATAAVILAVPLAIVPELAVAVFSQHAADEFAVVVMADVLRWTALFFVFDGWQVLFVHALRGLRRVVMPMALSTATYWLIGIGGGAALAELGELAERGIWIGFCAGLATAALLLGLVVARELPAAQ